MFTSSFFQIIANHSLVVLGVTELVKRVFKIKSKQAFFLSVLCSFLITFVISPFEIRAFILTFICTVLGSNGLFKVVHDKVSL